GAAGNGIGEVGDVTLGVSTLANALQHANCKLTALHLEWNVVGAEGAKLLAAAVQHANCQLQELHLAGNGVREAGTLALAAALRNPNCKLRSLRLDGNGVGESGVSTLVSALESYNCKLRTLRLGGNEVGENGVFKLAEVLQHPNCRLSALNLAYYKLDDDVDEASNELQQLNCKLQTLNIAYDGISDEGAAALANALQHRNCKLSSLHLNGNGVRDAGAASLAAALQHVNCKLQSLHLEGNQVGDTGALSLATALQNPNCRLKELHLAGNAIKSEGGAILSECQLFSACDVSGVIGGNTSSISKFVYVRAVDVLKARLAREEITNSQGRGWMQTLAEWHQQYDDLCRMREPLGAAAAIPSTRIEELVEKMEEAIQWAQRPHYPLASEEMPAVQMQAEREAFLMQQCAVRAVVETELVAQEALEAAVRPRDKCRQLYIARLREVVQVDDVSATLAAIEASITALAGALDPMQAARPLHLSNEPGEGVPWPAIAVNQAVEQYRQYKEAGTEAAIEAAMAASGQAMQALEMQVGASALRGAAQLCTAESRMQVMMEAQCAGAAANLLEAVHRERNLWNSQRVNLEGLRRCGVALLAALREEAHWLQESQHVRQELEVQDQAVLAMEKLAGLEARLEAAKDKLREQKMSVEKMQLEARHAKNRVVNIASKPESPTATVAAAERERSDSMLMEGAARNELVESKRCLQEIRWQLVEHERHFPEVMRHLTVSLAQKGLPPDLAALWHPERRLSDFATNDQLPPSITSRHKVYRVTESGRLNDVYVVKEFEIRATEHDEALRSLWRRVHMLQRMQHRGIVPVVAVFKAREVDPVGRKFHAIQMPFYAQGQLDVWVRKAKVDERELRRTLLALLQAIVHVHAHGIAHNDICPENVLVDASGRPHISNFDSCVDVSKSADGGTPTSCFVSKRQHHGNVFGAPELAVTGPTFATDMFAFGRLVEVVAPRQEDAAQDILEDLLHRLASLEPAKRPTAAQACQHPYFDVPQGSEDERRTCCAPSSVTMCSGAEHSLRAGVECSNRLPGGPHFTCDACLVAELTRSNGALVCPCTEMKQCDSGEYADMDLATHLPHAEYEMYLSHKRQQIEEQIREMQGQRKADLERELACLKMVRLARGKLAMELTLSFGVWHKYLPSKFQQRYQLTCIVLLFALVGVTAKETRERGATRETLIGVVDTIWEMPLDEPKYILFFAHGCYHSATDMWGNSKVCPECESGLNGLIEEKRIRQTALGRGYVVVAMNSGDRENNRCWQEEFDDTNVDLERVTLALQTLMQREQSLSQLPLYVFGAGSGGTFASMLPHRMQIAGVLLMNVALRHAVATAHSQHGNFPQTLFLSFDTDKHLNSHIERSISALKVQRIRTGKLQVTSHRLTAEYFSTRTDGFIWPPFSAPLSYDILRTLIQAGLVTEVGDIKHDPRTSPWPQVLRADPVMQKQYNLSSSSLDPENSVIGQQLRIAYGKHQLFHDDFVMALEWLEGLKETFTQLKVRVSPPPPRNPSAPKNTETDVKEYFDHKKWLGYMEKFKQEPAFAGGIINQSPPPKTPPTLPPPPRNIQGFDDFIREKSGIHPVFSNFTNVTLEHEKQEQLNHEARKNVSEARKSVESASATEESVHTTENLPPAASLQDATVYEALPNIDHRGEDEKDPS
ncbi:hypothetical protein CYMTET_52226, partial [Cymbomonas tetramitiformis]